ncbi:SUMO ligase siz1 [Aspergillus tubingensis]|uniref:SUMO ligase siz1 n=1 Tax=Aspergillus tubingensis TaxID=5068 RepID=A0A8H3XU85_ASPTU|nr:MIZ zinc finger protein [Aspergillus tubingensis]GFN12108.1 MIZ zinc finger protein [Aspergillus tubingensis]GLA58607.1 SUMO ligase siz1 [Aspergillus tubingensis]GLA73093.1 SUMO ligase siz1 [Aspergillus tubingensis]GLA85421.1 SUMO ligase siz1 [Aspergillus tubingensis]GLB20183.1 SUMO ligase siz1 [Aspergillus tubingensis]
MASTGQLPDTQSLVALVKTLTNAQLKDILRNEGLAVSGVKASLQLRIIDYIERLNQGGHVEQYDDLRKFIYATARRPMPTSPTTQAVSSQHYQPHTVNQPLLTQHRPSPLSIPMPSHGHTSGRLTFKDSPFYTVIEPLTSASECKVREQTRDSVELKVILTPTVATRLQADPNIRVMVYCAADTGLNQYTKSDIAFPHQVELKANLDEVKANLRGLKNKPGTTRPADVTQYIRKKPGYPNNIVMTYALTQKRFFVLVNLVQRHPVEELVAELKRRKTISKEQVLREMRNKAGDSDIVATSSVMSLKCPLSTLRIEVPCRSVICTHNQCFDASSFLQLQEQAPTWSCPVCSKATSFESLQIDQYVDDILRSTSLDVEQVIIEPDGQWSSPNQEDSAKVGGFTPATDDDDELIEIREPGVTPIKRESFPPTSLYVHQTPTQSREPSATSSAVYLSTNKRNAAQVIDLTGSDEEDDTPVRPVKRPAFNQINRPSSQQDFCSPYSGGYVNGDIQLPSQPSSDFLSHAGGYDARSY